MGEGQKASGMMYRPKEWHEKNIRARRFLPCPHCGSAVTGRERIWTSPYSGGGQAVFREAKCADAACGWRYFKHNGSREEFVAEVNRRIKTHGERD